MREAYNKWLRDTGRENCVTSFFDWYIEHNQTRPTFHRPYSTATLVRAKRLRAQGTVEVEHAWGDTRWSDAAVVGFVEGIYEYLETERKNP
jgi:hypothetical protein